jgi:hypothetical protein
VDAGDCPLGAGPGRFPLCPGGDGIQHLLLLAGGNLDRGLGDCHRFECFLCLVSFQSLVHAVALAEPGARRGVGSHFQPRSQFFSLQPAFLGDAAAVVLQPGAAHLDCRCPHLLGGAGAFRATADLGPLSLCPAAPADLGRIPVSHSRLGPLAGALRAALFHPRRCVWGRFCRCACNSAGHDLDERGGGLDGSGVLGFGPPRDPPQPPFSQVLVPPPGPALSWRRPSSGEPTWGLGC